MEAKKVLVDLKELDLLEQKIGKATDLIRSLRRDRDLARAKLQETQEQLSRVQSEFRVLEKDRDGARQLSEQMEILREERQVIRGRVTRMLEMMAALDDSTAPAASDH